MFTYQQQTEYRDRLREQGRERVSEIVAKINAGEYLNPRIEELLVQLSDRLSRTTGKKVYGYIADAAKVKNSKPAADIYLAAAEGLIFLFPFGMQIFNGNLCSRIVQSAFPDVLRLYRGSAGNGCDCSGN